MCIIIINSCSRIIDRLALKGLFYIFQTIFYCSKVEQNKIGRKLAIFIRIKVV